MSVHVYVEGSSIGMLMSSSYTNDYEGFIIGTRTTHNTTPLLTDTTTIHSVESENICKKY